MSKAAKEAVKATKEHLRVVLPAGKAAPGPPLGPILGSRGVKAMDFVKEFNAKTTNYVENTPVNVALYIGSGRSLTYDILTPTTFWLLKQAGNLQHGSGSNKTSKAGTLSLKHIYAVAEIKKKDKNLQAAPMESIVRSILATCKSAGIEVVK